MSTLLERVQSRIAELEAARSAVDAELSDIAADPEARGFTTTDDALARVDELRTEGARISTELAAAQERVAALQAEEARQAAAATVRPASIGGAIVRSEARTYDANAREDNGESRSFFADAYRAQYLSDYRAQERIQRHMREVEVERRDITSSTLNGLIPPLYLLDQAATLARAGRPFANAVPNFALPSTGMSVVITRVTTGTATAAQTSQNTAVAETDVVTADLTVPVVTIGGQQDISRQALERGAVTDQLIFNDLVSDYATRLDAQCINGSGANGQHFGIINTTSVGTDSYAATTVAAFYGSVNAAAARVATNRYLPASVVVMHPRRWHWLLSKSDSTGRPLAMATAAVATNPVAVGGVAASGFAGVLQNGLPVIVDANVPTNLGSSTDEDRVIVTRIEDHVLWEAPLMTFAFEQAVNPPVTVRLAVAGYSAFTAGRYPAGTSLVQGTGLVAPTYG